MSKERLRMRPGLLQIVFGVFPIAALIYIAFALYHDFSQIGDIPPKPKPVPRVVPLPGRPPGPAAVPPPRTLAVPGGYPAIRERLKPLHRPPDVSRPGRRLAQEADLGQTFELWRDGAAAPAVGGRRVVYVQRIGAMSPAEERVAALAAELLGLYFGLPVREPPALPVDAAWPKEARRGDPAWGADQLFAPHVLDAVLAPRIPADALVVLGLTAHGLWADDRWSFTYGVTDPSRRIGIWSTARDGDPTASLEEQEAYVRRVLKTAVHEVGHVLGIAHCTAYTCAMRAAYDRDGLDARPLWLCPECEAKLLAATGVDPAWHSERLAAFFRELELGEEAWFYERELFAVRQVRGLDPPFSPGTSLRDPPPVCAAP